MARTIASRQWAIALASVAITSLVFVALGGRSAEADHEPANKVAAAGSQVEVFGPNVAVPLLHERVKISSPFDAVIQASAECDILTDLTTGGSMIPLSADNASAFGQVRMWVTIDDRVVPVSTDDTTETGKVVFCNRAHSKTVNDGEIPDGIDRERDMTRTRQANAFNWIALNIGFAYDDPANGNNIVDITLWGELTEGPNSGEALAEAIVGHRTLIVEPTNASVHEEPAPAG